MEIIDTVSFSDLVLTILVLAGAACAVWVLDLNPYGKQLQIYSQTCNNMILDNSYCKGSWQDNPVETFHINPQTNQITHKPREQIDIVVYKNCTIENSKNWQCANEVAQSNIVVKDGLLIYTEKNNIRQISRLEWLQNKFLEWLN